MFSNRCLPMLYISGTHKEVGYNIGATFKLIIQNFLNSLSYFQDEYIPFYLSDKGKNVYNGYLKTCEQVFPQYVEELKGIASGAEVPFHKLFLLHLAGEIDTFLGGSDFGCTAALVNSPNQLLIGHNEDAYAQARNTSYIVHACIRDKSPDGKVLQEEWTSFCYPGHLAGFTMGTNSSGLAYSINILYPKNVILKRLPSQFLTRALLSATDIVHLEEILYNKGCGCASGFSVNVGFLDYPQKIMWNFEVAPCPERSESLVHKVEILEDFNNDTTKPCGLFLHYNKYNFLHVESMDKSSSDHRDGIVKKLNESCDLKGILNILGNTSDPMYPVYRDAKPPDSAATLATGVFDLLKKTWSIYIGNPIICTEPLAVIPLVVKKE